MGTTECIECGHRATDRARFCERCGAALVPGAQPLRAPRELESTILGERSAIEGERKQVTVMYADVAGSMALTRALDGERWGFVLDRFLGIAARAVHAYEGTVNQFTGDGLLAVFGAPLAHEDHARRACLAVLELQRNVAALADEVQQRDGVTFAVRCGLNSGEVVVGSIGDDVHMDFVPIGDTTNLGKRIESLAAPGSAAISASTAALVDGEFELRELGEFALKGGDGPQRVLELVGRGEATTRLEATAATRGLSPFVGRGRENAELRSHLERALGGDGRAVGIVGEAGVGKSRLVHELAAACAARGVAVLSGAGVTHGRFVPFLPVLALCRDAVGIGEHDQPATARERIATAVLALDAALADDLPLLFEFLGVADAARPLDGMDPVARRQRLLTAATRVLTARPAVLVLEDLHWFDDASDAFLEQLVAAVAGTPTLLVATYRPEYEAPWAAETPHAQLDVAPLEPGATDDLLTGLLGDHRSLDGLAAPIGKRAAGNPFFVEEIVQALVDTGHLTGARGAYRLAAAVDALVLPPTVEAGLAARIDRLRAREKALVQTMAVIGTEIPAALLSEVSDLGDRQLADAVSVLATAQWVVFRGAGDSREYAFKHPLTREVAYGSQLSDRRTRAHAAVAAAIERAYPDGLDERAALVAHHCEAAGDDLAAAGWHARAAAWAEVGSPADGMRHWRRVRDLASPLEPSPQRDELAARAYLGILGLAWRLGIAAEEMAALRAEAESAAWQSPAAHLFHAGSLMHRGSERDGLDGFRTVFHGALAAGDAGLALTASCGVAYASWVAGSPREGMEAVDRALPLVDDDPAIGAHLVFPCPLAHAYGDRGMCRGYLGEHDKAWRDFDRAIMLARRHDDPETESATHANRAMLEASIGDHRAALRSAALGLAISERSGNSIHIIACAVPAAVAKAGAGRFAEALADAEANLAAIREHEIGLYYEPVLLATIARSRLALGEAPAALDAAQEAVAIADRRGLVTCAQAARSALAEVQEQI